MGGGGAPHILSANPEAITFVGLNYIGLRISTQNVDLEFTKNSLGPSLSKTCLTGWLYSPILSAAPVTLTKRKFSTRFLVPRDRREKQKKKIWDSANMFRINRLINQTRASLITSKQLLTHEHKLFPQHYAQKSSTRFLDIYQVS